MSKWNMQTAQGAVVSAEGYTDAEAPTSHFDQAFARNAQHKTCQERLREPKTRVALCVLALLVVIGIVLAIIYPRMPVVTVDRSSLARGIKFIRVDNVITRIQGDVSVTFDNPNLYSISVAGIVVEGTIGRFDTSRVNFSGTIGAIEIPANQVSTRVVSFDLPLPPAINAIQLGLDVTADCLGDNRFSTTISTTSDVEALGTKMVHHAGPFKLDSDCL